MNWHTREERRVIRRRGGTPRVSYGFDGYLFGHPCEVRSHRKDERYRIQQDVHQVLVARRGNYIFVDNGRTKVIPARKVSKQLGRGKWFKDRNYPHKFLSVNDVF